MYYEHSSITARSGWKYVYTGEQLLPEAKWLYDACMHDQSQERETMAAKLRDPTITTSSLDKHRAEIERLGPA